ncbi:unnamed protein product [Rangifer tarandus platyrhynchus]|uniref:Uncharacterized protein n=1 Tax=Rangifer tarandus platyrhynchus TaxID=3082113 RepID=A0AC59Y6F5_RANTA
MVSALFGKGRLFLGAQYCPLLENRSNTSANGPATRPEGARGFMRCAGLGCCGRCIADLGHLTGPLSTSRTSFLEPAVCPGQAPLLAVIHSELYLTFSSTGVAALRFRDWPQDPTVPGLRSTFLGCVYAMAHLGAEV